MRDGIADGDAECKEENAADSVETNAENNVTDDPAVVEGADNEDELRNNVDDGDNQWEDQVGDEQTNRLGIA